MVRDSGGDTFMHEVYAITYGHNYEERTGLAAGGINNSVFDEYIYEEQIRGKVVAHLFTPDCGL